MTIKMANLSFLLGAGFLIFFILTIVFLVLYIKANSEKIDPQNCPSTKGNYGVTSNVNPDSLKNIFQCTVTPDGTSGTSICNFSANNLFEAEGICNKYPLSTCSAFYFNQSQKNMIFVSPDFGITQATLENVNYGDVYTR
jgi:hypothetical protein